MMTNALQKCRFWVHSAVIVELSQHWQFLIMSANSANKLVQSVHSLTLQEILIEPNHLCHNFGSGLSFLLHVLGV